MTENETNDNVLVFDWRAENALNRDSLLAWLIPSTMRLEDKDELVHLTNNFSNCQLTMQLNGVEMDATAFLNGITWSMEHAVKIEAARLLAGVGFDLDRLFVILHDRPLAL